MSLEIARKVKTLEAKVAEQGKLLEALRQLIDNATLTQSPASPIRAMCPKCGVKPNHFFHVKNCRGTQEEQKNADDKRRDPGTT